MKIFLAVFTRFFIAVASLVFAMQSQVLSAEQAIVANKTIYRGQVIQGDDLQAVALMRQPKHRLKFVSQESEIVGQVALRTILPGRFISPRSVRLAHLVKSGERMRVQLSKPGLNISIDAVALTDGGVGEVISLRNAKTGRQFRAQILADGTATVVQ